VSLCVLWFPDYWLEIGFYPEASATGHLVASFSSLLSVFKRILNYVEFEGFNSGDYEERRLLGCGAV
jgi:hypothetical protein